MAKRPLWNGVIGFGLVQIPVGMHSAEEHGEDLSMTMLDADDHAPVGYKHYNKVTGVEVPKERRIKGYEVAKDEYVVLTDADFKAANVKATETIEIHFFVDADEIPSLRLDRPYFLSPQKKGAKPYLLFRQALQMTGKVAVATVVMRARQSLCAVFPVGDALALQTLRYDDEVRGVDDLELETELGKITLKPAEIEMAVKLVEGMEAPFDTSGIRDTYKDDLLAIIDDRTKNPEHIPTPRKLAEPIDASIDLIALLQESVSQRLSSSSTSSSSSSSAASKKQAASRAAHAPAGRPRRTRAAAPRRSGHAG